MFWKFDKEQQTWIDEANFEKQIDKNRFVVHLERKFKSRPSDAISIFSEDHLCIDFDDRKSPEIRVKLERI
jgi:hypothetical protein